MKSILGSTIPSSSYLPARLNLVSIRNSHVSDGDHLVTETHAHLHLVPKMNIVRNMNSIVKMILILNMNIILDMKYFIKKLFVLIVIPMRANQRKVRRTDKSQTRRKKR